ncbi:hypothetical protein QBC46DRAFT_157535 [Diplogelasinospora grovesii]|uniref:Uncharacterized protein n=1 Tax=Diplogelasinospora grovesii TaxID=303347 RepID=A0AAN6NF54_9PEZI|nr:hypothetical protein QBC46DRAFT_157535 [Diplogelasinospora grovesii]
MNSWLSTFSLDSSILNDTRSAGGPCLNSMLKNIAHAERCNVGFSFILLCVRCSRRPSLAAYPTSLPFSTISRSWLRRCGCGCGNEDHFSGEKQVDLETLAYLRVVLSVLGSFLTAPRWRMRWAHFRFNSASSPLSIPFGFFTLYPFICTYPVLVLFILAHPAHTHSTPSTLSIWSELGSSIL